MANIPGSFSRLTLVISLLDSSKDKSLIVTSVKLVRTAINYPYSAVKNGTLVKNPYIAP